MKKLRIVLFLVLTAAVGSPAFGSDEYLEVIGALGGSNLYTSYFSLGMLMDGFENDVYDEDMAMDIAREIEGAAGYIRETLAGLVEKNLVSGEDRNLILEMTAAQDLLEKQAAELLKHIGDPEAPNDFQYYRLRAWEKISRILGLPE